MFLLIFLVVFRLSHSVLYGSIASKQEVHSSVFLQIDFPSWIAICGGVISPTGLLLTANHCLLHDGIRAKRITVTIGEFDRFGREEISSKQNFTIDSIREVSLSRHEVNDDLALLTVPKEICHLLPQRSAKLPPSLPNDGFFHQNEVPLSDEELEKALCWASGWGINEKNDFSRYPKTAQLGLTFQHFGYSSPVLVAKYKDQSRFCQGDSGSPVFCWLRSSRYLVGLLSEIGGDARMDENVTTAEQCSSQQFVLITDLRSKLQEISQIRSCGH